MSDYPNENGGELILVVQQDGRDFGVPIGTGIIIGTVTAIDGMICTVMSSSGRSLRCDVFYDEPCIGDRVAVFSESGRRYAMIGLRNKGMTE